jgi:hypothetical protein
VLGGREEIKGLLYGKQMNICGLGEGGVEVRSDPLKGVIQVLLPSSCLTIRCKDWREGGVS